MELDFFSEPRVAEFPTIIAKVDRVLLILSLETDISEFDGFSYGWAAVNSGLQEEHVMWVSFKLVHSVPR